MKTPLADTLDLLQSKNPQHFEKVSKYTAHLGEAYIEHANRFLGKYKAYMATQSATLEDGMTDYLKLVDAMYEARIDFLRTGKYANTSFDEVEKSIYANPEIMKYHMHGLVFAQFLWFDQYERFLFFSENLTNYVSSKHPDYLEIGGGHGLYMNEALRLLPQQTRFDLVDISESSMRLAKGIINSDRVSYKLQNVFDLEDTVSYNFITIGEVIEHVEEPLLLMKKVASLLKPEGTCYMTTPINAPMIDHIYLFNNEDEIRDMMREAGLNIVEEKIVISEKVSAQRAAKMKVPVMYAAFLKKAKA